MAKRRKDYRVARQPEPLIGEPQSLTVNFLDDRGQLNHSFDFSIYAEHGEMAAELALAFRQHHAGGVAATRKSAFPELAYWFRFLRAHEEPVRSMRDIDDATLRNFIAWLDRQSLGKGSRHTIWSVVKQLLVWLRRNRLKLTNPALEFPFDPFPPQERRDAIT